MWPLVAKARVVRAEAGCRLCRNQVDFPIEAKQAFVGKKEAKPFRLFEQLHCRKAFLISKQDPSEPSPLPIAGTRQERLGGKDADEVQSKSRAIVNPASGEPSVTDSGLSKIG